MQVDPLETENSPSCDRTSCSLNIPLDILDADLVAGLFIIVEPFALRQIYARELGTRFRSFGQPLPLG